MTRMLGVALAGMFLLIAAGNLEIAVRWFAHGKGGSLVPLVGGPVGVAACLLLPIAALGRWSWVPLVVDLGTAPLALMTLSFLIRRIFKVAFGGREN